MWHVIDWTKAWLNIGRQKKVEDSYSTWIPSLRRETRLFCSKGRSSFKIRSRLSCIQKGSTHTVVIPRRGAHFNESESVRRYDSAVVDPIPRHTKQNHRSVWTVWWSFHVTNIYLDEIHTSLQFIVMLYLIIHYIIQVNFPNANLVKKRYLIKIKNTLDFVKWTRKKTDIREVEPQLFPCQLNPQL